MTQVTDKDAKEVLVIKYTGAGRGAWRGQFLVFQLLVVVVVLAAVAAVSVAQSTGSSARYAVSG